MSERLEKKEEKWSAHLLFADRFAPMTSEIGFLEAGIDGIVDTCLTWMRSVARDVAGDKAAEVTGRVVQLERLESLIGALLPLRSVRPNRHLFAKTTGSWVAYFDNSSRGTDAFPVVSYLASVMSCRGVRVVAIPNTLQGTGRQAVGRYGALIFELYGAQKQDEPLNVERTIGVVNDGGRWRFDTGGAPLPFERVESYEKRNIRDRFTFDLLTEYCASLGLNPFSESFYKTEGRLIEIQSKLPKNARDVSLEEARTALGIRPS